MQVDKGVHGCVHTETRRGHQESSSTAPIFYFKMGSHWTQSAVQRLGLQTCTAMPGFSVGAGGWTQVLLISQQVLLHVKVCCLLSYVRECWRLLRKQAQRLSTCQREQLIQQALESSCPIQCLPPWLTASWYMSKLKVSCSIITLKKMYIRVSVLNLCSGCLALTYIGHLSSYLVSTQSISFFFLFVSSFFLEHTHTYTYICIFI